MTEDDGPQVDRWRDLLSPRYGYPDDLADTAGDGLSGRQRRRAVRGARKDWRERDRAARNEWLAQRRREGEDETTSTGRLVILVIVAAVIVVLMVTGWLRATGGDGDGDGAPPPANPQPTPAAPSSTAEDDAAAGESAGSDTSPSSDPPASSSAEGEVQEPAAVAQEWAAAWFNFDPAAQSGPDRLDLAAQYQLDTLTDWLATQDTSAAYYINHEAVLGLDSAEVGDAPAGAPVDTPTRTTLQVIVTTTMAPAEGEARSTVLPYVVTLEREDPASEWLVAWFEEGAHE